MLGVQVPRALWGINRSMIVMREGVSDWTISEILAGAWGSAGRLMLARSGASEGLEILWTLLLVAAPVLTCLCSYRSWRLDLVCAGGVGASGTLGNHQVNDS